jgi:NADH-quinone oxidoreductase subunit N
MGTFYYGNITAQLQHILSGMGWLYPELTLALLLPVLLIAGILTPVAHRAVVLPAIMLIGTAFAMYFTWDQAGYLTGALQRSWFLGMIYIDGMSVVFRLLAGLAAGISALIALVSPPKEGLKTEFWLFMVTALLGMFFLSMASNFLMVFLALEMISISSYLMTGYMKDEPRSAEAALKYIIYGSVATAAFLYGASLMYGISGTLDFTSQDFIQALSTQPSMWVWMALLLMWSAIAFKIAAVPFHFWNPDVYEGAPAFVTAFLANGPKITALALIIRLTEPFRDLPQGDFAFTLLSITALLSMFAGNTAAFAQHHLHRLLAWSGIAHTGYMLAAIAVNTPASKGALVWYSFIYILANTGAFMVAGILKNRTGTVDIRELKGSGPDLIFPGVVLMLCLATLGGLPPTAGFFAKFNLFLPVLGAWQTTASPMLLILFLAMVLNTILSLYYYLRPAAWMFLKPAERRRAVYLTRVQQVFVILPAIAVLIAGILGITTLAGWMYRLMEL